MEVGKQSMQWRPSQRAQLLAPFDHQVAGQSSMLVYDATTLCKPLIPREHFVYQTLPVELQEFTPQYRGEILVKLQEKEGHIQLVGHAIGAAEIGDQTCPCTTEGEPDIKAKDCGSSSGVSSEQRNSFSSDASQALESSEASAAASYIYLGHEGVDPCSTSVRTMSSAASHLHPQTHNLNPWSMKNHKRLLEKMRKSSHRNNKTRFMLLGNVVAGFKKPCILDLKIGSRLHGDDASSTKVASQTGKCSRTTSSSLGVRLCGMQVYQVTTDRYMNLDKYHGRTLTVETFEQTLRDFLHNGIRFRQELLQPIIARLAALITCVRRLDSYRFYASSLLIMYDGEVEHELPTFKQLDTFQHIKHNAHLNKQRATKGEELRNKDGDASLLDIDLEVMDSKQRRVRSADQVCVQHSKAHPGSVAAAPSSQSIYDSTSTTDVPSNSKTSPTQVQHYHSSNMDPSTFTNNVVCLEKDQPVSSNKTEATCVHKTAADSFNLLTLSHSSEVKDCSSVDNTRNKHLSLYASGSHKSVLCMESSQEEVKSLSHSSQVLSSKDKQGEKTEALYSVDPLVEQSSSKQNYEDECFGDETLIEQDGISEDLGMMKREDRYNVNKNDFSPSLVSHSEKLALYESRQLFQTPVSSKKATDQHLMLSRASESLGRLKVDVKMIDFAHTTHSGFESDKIKHSGPDADYVTGLENLKCLFECLCSHQDFG